MIPARGGALPLRDALAQAELPPRERAALIALVPLALLAMGLALVPRAPTGATAAAVAAFILAAARAAGALTYLLAATRRELRAQADKSDLTQQELRQSRRRLQLLLDHMPDGVLAFGVEGHVEWINPAARSIFHCSTADAVGHPTAALIPEIEALLRDQSASAPAAGMAPAQVPRLSTRGRRRDGNEFPLEIAIVRLRADGLQVGMCVCRDITDAQRIDRLKSEFVSMVSHELRTPLTSLRGSLSLLADGAVADLPADALRLLRLASNNAERLVILVNDILDYERLRAGALTLDIEPVDLVDTARYAIESLEGMASPAQVRLVLQADDDVPVLADAARLVQVLVNLLSNAIKYSPTKGTVRIRIAHSGERARLVVCDDGPGVPADFVPRLFQPFEQAIDPSHHKRGGTGLGLAITRGLVEMMHGAIGLAPPVPGRGAEFWVELPLNNARPSTFGDLD